MVEIFCKIFIHIVEWRKRGEMCPWSSPWLAFAVSKPSVVEFPALECWPFGPSHFSSLETLSDWMILYFPLQETLWCHNSSADSPHLGQMGVSEIQGNSGTFGLSTLTLRVSFIRYYINWQLSRWYPIAQRGAERLHWGKHNSSQQVWSSKILWRFSICLRF